MSTYGDIRLRFTKQFPGIDDDLRDGWIVDRYTAILDRLDWERRQVEAWLQTTAEYETGTVAVTNGSTAVTGTGTVWTAAMTGRRIRIAGDDEWYTFTRTGNTTGTLERNYEGTTDADATYSIFQNVYTLPAACKILDEIRSFQLDLPLEKVSLTKLNEIDPSRNSYGDPEKFALWMEDTSDPPQMRVELWPIPEDSHGLPYLYTAEAPTLTGTSTTILPWVRPAALIEGISADACMLLAQKEPAYLAIADRHELRFEARVLDMIRTESRSRGAEQLGMADRFVRHRQRRWTR